MLWFIDIMLDVVMTDEAELIGRPAEDIGIIIGTKIRMINYSFVKIQSCINSLDVGVTVVKGDGT